MRWRRIILVSHPLFHRNKVSYGINILDLLQKPEHALDKRREVSVFSSRVLMVQHLSSFMRNLLLSAVPSQTVDKDKVGCLIDLHNSCLDALLEYLCCFFSIKRVARSPEWVFHFSFLLLAWRLGFHRSPRPWISLSPKYSETLPMPLTSDTLSV